MDIQGLLAVRDEAEVSGENLEYDDVFTAMEIAARPGQERQAGKQIIAAEEPDALDVASKALAVLEKSHDLRAGVVLAGALLTTEGLPGLARATAYLRGCIEQYWATCHPVLDAEDDNDPTMRVNSLQGLGAAEPMLRLLRRAPLSDSRSFGRVTLRDLEIVAGEATGETSFDAGSIGAAFSDTDPGRLGALLAAARGVQADLRAIEVKFAQETPGQGPDLGEVAKMVGTMVRHLSGALGEAEVPEAPAGDPAAEAEVPPPAGARRGGSGAIETPADVSAALDAIIAYYRRCEPSSPVPILLERAKRLVNADFLTILRDMAPLGIENVLNVGGLSGEPE